MKIKVYVLEFYACTNTHIEIVLAAKLKGETYYYGMNMWENADEHFTNQIDYSSLIKDADRKRVFEIEESMESIVKAWKTYQNNNEGDTCGNNCADATAWFLERYLNIPNPGSCGRPVTCNLVCCGMFAPSFLQSCTLPGRVMDYMDAAIEKTGNAGPARIKMK